MQIRSPLEEFSEEDWGEIMVVNLTGVFLVSKYTVEGMIKRKFGKIINLGSLQCELARPTITPYSASKGGVKMLTRAMAMEWGSIIYK